MFKPLELFIGTRYLRARRRNQFVSFISLASILGIGVGVAALIVVLSVMNGFSNELRSRLLSLTSHATVTSTSGRLTDWAVVREASLSNERVIGAAPFVEGEGMLVNGSRLAGVLVSGVLPALEPGVSEIGDKLVRGNLDSLVPGQDNLLLGIGLAQILGVGVGDGVNILVPRLRGETGIVPRLQRFTVTGIFEAGIQEHDGVRALAHLADASALFGLDGGVSGVRLKLEDLLLAPLATRELDAVLGDEFEVSDWTIQQSTYFRAIRIEKMMMFVILSLVVTVAAFNIVATLVMVVTDKRSDIAILRTMGMSPGSVMSVFVVQGVFIGLIGTLLGVGLGVALALNVETLVPRIEALFNIRLIPADVYYVTQIPSDLRWPEVTGIGVAAFLLAALSTIYPARRAAAVEPAEALRYE